MKYTSERWAEKRQRGLLRFLIFDGVLIMGGPFAVVMQVVGSIFLRGEGQGFGEYFAATRTWVTFFLHATLFGLIMGFINWYRHERTFVGPKNNGEQQT